MDQSAAHLQSPDRGTEDQYGGMIYTYLQIFGIDELETCVQQKKFKLNKKYQFLIDQSRLRVESDVS